MARILYRGKWFVAEEILREGRAFERIRIPNAVCILPLVDENNLIMEYHYRPVVDKRLYELPAGQIENSERPVHAAKRELLEETGYKAGKLYHLFDSYMSPGILSELVHFYLAKDLVKVSQKTDKAELESVSIVSIRRAERLLKENKLINAHTMLGLLYYLKYVKKQ